MLFGKKGSKKKHNTRSSKIIVGETVYSTEAEGYNRLKDNVLYLNPNDESMAIQIESSLSHEGKTTVACNLAVSLGYTDKKVILVDLDFRRPRSHRLFELSKEVGIAEYLTGELKLEDIIKTTKYKNVSLMTRGAEIHNPSLVLVSDKFKALIKELRKMYDYIILDCPPVLQTSDYIHISKVADGTLFLVAYATTTRTQVREAIAELHKNGVKLLGSVITMYDKKKDRGSGYYSGKYYAYSYFNNEKDEEENEKR